MRIPFTWTSLHIGQESFTSWSDSWESFLKDTFLAGFGNSYASGASGASHGGRGGRHLHNSAPLPNSPFGDIFSIGACGSGGGTGSSSGGGGRGGGRLELNATDTINFSGRITVNGRSATVGFTAPLFKQFKPARSGVF